MAPEPAISPVVAVNDVSDCMKKNLRLLDLEGASAVRAAAREELAAKFSILMTVLGEPAPAGICEECHSEEGSNDKCFTCFCHNQGET